ncbi:hypothetical protein H0H93_013450 [Arthromyces matolae]|nr:hypothetical protein H0H93_013450 [Arthromyces matolae]
MSSLEEGAVYTIVNVKSNTILDLSHDGVTIHGWEPTGAENQKADKADAMFAIQWELLSNANFWTLRNVATGQFLGRGDDEIVDNVPVTAGDNPEIWDIRPDEDDLSVFRLFVPGTNFVVDLSDFGNPDNGTPIALWGNSQANENQTWRFE